MKYTELMSYYKDPSGAENMSNRWEKLVRVIEGAVFDVNIDLYDTQTIRKSFELCGLDPFLGDTRLEEHLSKSNESSIYEMLTYSHTTLNLNPITQRFNI